MKHALIILYLFTSALSMKAQGDSIALTKNVAYFELLGAGLLYSANYERLLAEAKKIGIYGRVGYTYLPNNILTDIMIEEQEHMFPVGLSVVYKKSDYAFAQLHIEQGIYLAWLLHNVKKYNGTTFVNQGLWLSVNVIGLRVHFKESGFFTRIALGMIYHFGEIYYNDLIQHETPTLFPTLGISMGYAFSKKKSN